MSITSKDGLDPFDRFTLKNLGVVIDNDGVVIAKSTKKKEEVQ